MRFRGYLQFKQRFVSGFYSLTASIFLISACPDALSQISVKLPPGAAENAGVLTNAGQVLLPRLTATNLTIQLQAFPTNHLVIPATVTIPAGSSNISFNLTLIDDLVPETNTPVLLTASAPDFPPATAQMIVRDDDPARFSISIPLGGFTVGLPFAATIRALSPTGQALTAGNFNADLQFLSSTDTNLAPVSQVTLRNGAGSASITPDSVALGARLKIDALGASGESRPLNVFEPVERFVTGSFRDILSVPGSPDLLASIPSDARNHPNEIVRIHAETGAIETWTAAPSLFPAENRFAGQMTLSPDGQTLFALTGDGSQAQAWNVSSRSLIQTFTLPNGIAETIAVAAGSPWRLLVSTKDASYFFDETGTAHFNPRPVESATAHPTRPETFYVFLPYSVLEWQTTNSGLSQSLELHSGPNQQTHVDLAVLNERLFTIHGPVLDLATRKPAGSIPVPTTLATRLGSGRLAVDAARNQIVRAYPGSNNVTRLESFGATDLLPHREAVVPFALNDIKRLLILSSNRLAILNGTDLRLIRWPVTGTGDLIDLTVQPVSRTAIPRIGEPWDWVVAILNSGPGAATDLELRVPLSTGLNPTNIVVPGGSFVLEGNTIRAHLPALGPTHSVDISFSVIPAIGGFTDFTFIARANEDESDFANNIVQTRLPVAAGTSAESVHQLRLPFRDLAFDSVHRKLYALEINARTATNTPLYEIDPTTFIPRPIRALPGYASHLRVSSDGHFLHVATRQGRSALRIDLIGATADLDYEIASTNHTLYAFEIPPLDSSSVLVAGSTIIIEDVHLESEVALFKDGLKLPQSVSLPVMNGAYSGTLQFNLGTNEAYLSLFPKNNVDRFLVDASGVRHLDGYFRPNVSPGFALADGKIYTSYSQELVARSGQLLRNLPSQPSGRFGNILYQPELDQVLFLQLMNSDSLSLQIFDRVSLARIATIPVAGVGVPNSMVDLKDGRLAIATPSGDLFLVASSALRPSTIATDLQVTIQVDPAAPKLDDNVTLRIIATNAGTNSPIAPALTAELPVGFSTTNSEPRPLRHVKEFQHADFLLWTNFTLAPGASVTNILRGTFSQSGHMKIAAGIADRTDDPRPENNSASLTLPISLDLQPGKNGVTSYKVLSAAYDSIRDRIIASTSATSYYAGRVLAINPQTGLVEKTFDFGENPSVLTLADDSQTLYLAINHGTNIARANLASGQVEAVFSGFIPNSGLPNHIYWMGANPGHPDQVFARADLGLGLFSNGQLLASTNYHYGPLAIYGPNKLVRSPDYAPHPIQRIQFDGQQFLFSEGGPSFMHFTRAADGLLVDIEGRIVDAETLNFLGQVNGGGAPIISPRDRLLFNFGFAPGGHTLRTFDLDTQTLLAEEPIHSLVQGNSPAQGIDGFEAGPEFLAYRLQDNYLRIHRRSRAETNSPADLNIALRSDSTWRAGSLGAWNITVQNSGSNVAPATRIDLRLPDGFRAVQVEGGRILPSQTNHLSIDLGPFPAQASAAVRVTAVPDRAFTSAEVVASTRSLAADPDRANNSARLAHPVESSSLPNLLEIFDLPGSDLVYDPAAKKLYVAGLNEDTAQSTTLSVVNPATGQVERSVPLPGRPIRLALSSASEYLYIALDGGQRVARYRLPSFEQDLLFTTPASAWYKADLFVPQGQPRTVVLSLYGAFSPSPGGVWVYDDDQARPLSIPAGFQGVTFIEPGAAPDELVAFSDQATLRKYRFTTEGLVFLSEQPHTQPPFGLASARHTLLGWPTNIFDPSTLQFRAALPTEMAPQAFTLSADGIHAVLAAQAGQNVRFEGFRTDALTLSGVAEIPLAAPVRALTLWGTDGIAALAGNALILGRLDLAAAPLDIVPFDDGSFRVLFPAAPGRPWQLQSASTPTGPWTDVAAAISTGGLQVIPVLIGANPAGFYRVVLAAP